jgi:hypothetical protein
MPMENSRGHLRNVKFLIGSLIQHARLCPGYWEHGQRTHTEKLLSNGREGHQVNQTVLGREDKAQGDVHA